MSSRLTVGVTEPAPSDGTPGAEALSDAGIAFDEWTEAAPLVVADGALSWIDHAAGPVSGAGTVAVAQVTVPTGMPYVAMISARGSNPDGTEWSQAVEFTIP